MSFIRTVTIGGVCTKQEGYNGISPLTGTYGFIGTSPAYPCDNHPWMDARGSHPGHGTTTENTKPILSGYKGAYIPTDVEHWQVDNVNDRIMNNPHATNETPIAKMLINELGCTANLDTEIEHILADEKQPIGELFGSEGCDPCRKRAIILGAIILVLAGLALRKYLKNRN